MYRTLLWIMLLSVLGGAQGIQNVTPRQALDLTKEPATYIVDVRSVAEYVLVGHPAMAVNIPISFWDERQREFVPNDNFLKDLKSRFKPEDRLIFMCRGGGRSMQAAKRALGAGFQKVLNITEGFEGPSDEKGYHTKGGWKNSGLPYTYQVDDKLAYHP